MSDTKYEPADIEVYIKNKGLVLRERSLIAYQHSDGKILAVGTEAEQKRDGVVVARICARPLRRLTSSHPMSYSRIPRWKLWPPHIL